MNEERIKSGARMLTYLLPADDVTLIILRGHLLVEEQLWAVVCERMIHPSAVKDARPRYYHLCSIAKRSLFRVEDKWLWEAVQQLNPLRNELVHRLESEKREQLIEKFLRPIETTTERIGVVRSDSDMLGRLKSGLSFMFGALLRFRRGELV